MTEKMARGSVIPFLPIRLPPGFPVPPQMTNHSPLAENIDMAGSRYHNCRVDNIIENGLKSGTFQGRRFVGRKFVDRRRIAFITA